MRPFAQISVLVLWLLWPGFVYADKMMTGGELRDGLMDYLAEKGYASQPVINARRLIRACKTPLDYKPLFGGVQTVEIICPDTDGWTLAIRTKAEANIPKSSQKPISSPNLPQQQIWYVVAKQSLKRGAIVTQDDLEMISGPATGFSDYYTSKDVLVGRRLKRNLGIGKIMRASYLEADWMVFEGQPVVLESQFGQVQVLSEGRALENAQFGEMARFLNVRSGREVYATVVSEKKVIIGANKL